MELGFTLQEDDLEAMFAGMGLPGTVPRYLIGLVVVACSAPWILVLPVRQAMAADAVILVAVLGLWWTQRSETKTAMDTIRKLNLNKSWRVSFSGEGLHIERAGGKITHSWAEIVGASLMRGALFVWAKREQLLVFIPARDLDDLKTQALEEIFAAHSRAIQKVQEK